MLLNTANTGTLLHSIAELLCTDKNKLIKFFEEKTPEIICNNYNEYSIDYLNLDIVKKFCNCSEVKVIDEIVVNHITPRKSYDTLMSEDVMTLPRALICDTELSRYLKKRGFKFDFTGNMVLSKREGKPIDWNNLRQSNMIMRFGGQYSLRDFNVNGYLFVGEWIVDFCRSWLGSPEILKSISTAYGDHSIADDYAEKCKNYIISFRVKVRDIDIEGKDINTGNTEKNDLLLKYSINALAHLLKSKRHDVDFYNPIIMLKRDYTVPKENIVAIHNLEVESYRVKVMDTVMLNMEEK